MNLTRRRAGLRRLAFGLLAVCTAAGAQAPAPKTPVKPERKPDLGDFAQGIYRGQIISNSRGSSSAPGEVVTVTFTRVGVNRVQIVSDHPSLPGTTVTLERVMDKVMNRDTQSTVLLDPRQKPIRLDYSFEQLVSFSGLRE